jgi:di- and tripeptidase
LVVAKFMSTDIGESFKAKTLLFYGHYDVQPAAKKKWSYPPWDMTGADGYLYGRGVSDNKGPILATVFAVASLYRNRQLHCNVCFLIEGEEEAGSVGFYAAVEQYRDYFGHVDVILISNSYWIDDETPCLTYGLRGVIHTEIEVVSPANADVHSGVMGGAFAEPLQDIVKVVGQLVARDRQVLIPGFNDSVRPTSREEQELFTELAAYAKTHVPGELDDMAKAQMLMAKWRFPTLTVHNIEVSGPSSNTVIPRSCKALVSMRIVPDQDLNDVINKFQRYIKRVFVELQSTNTLTITVGHRANWWLGNTVSKYFKAAERAIEQEWKMKPLHIREGGSIPAIPFLESVFKADAIHIPMGQASDCAHLPNERLRLQNLISGQRVIENFLYEISR